MTKVILVRHARSVANAEGWLAGRSDGIALDHQGVAQAKELSKVLPLAGAAAVYSSPIRRCLETASLAGYDQVTVVAELTECDYGTWTGRKISDLVTEPLWRQIQEKPSTVQFPQGETMADMQARCVEAIARITALHTGETVVVFSHGDPIKAILADALNMAFDDFQRLQVAPAGVSVIDYTETVPHVSCLNAGNISGLLSSAVQSVVGGGDVAGAH